MTIKVLAAFYMTTIGVASEGDIIEVPQATGEMLISVGLAEEFSGGGGGGSTATVTFINSGENTYYEIYPILLVDGVITQTMVEVETSVDVQIPLGENGASIPFAGDKIDHGTAPTSTGGVTIGQYGFEVTGDGTLTLVGTGTK